MNPAMEPDGAPGGPGRVVLLGGGYVTLHAYRSIVRSLGRAVSGDVEVVVVSADDAHAFHGFTGEVLAGELPLDVTRTPLVSVMPRARVLHAVATHVDVAGRTVTCRRVADGRTQTLGYDALVVGVGGREPLATVPGLAEHGFTLRGPGDIRRVAAHLDRVLRGARPGAGPAWARTVAVAGGGLAGAEMAAAVAGRGRASGAGLRVVLVQSGDVVVPGLASTQPRLATRCAAELDRLGVEVVTGRRLVEVTAAGAALDDGTVVPAATVLGMVGQRPVAVPGLDVLATDERGRLLTGPDLRVAPGVWAAGDVARVRHPLTGVPVPANALWAIKAGAHAGTNVARALTGRRPRVFRYPGLGQAASFGRGRSVVELYGVPFTGWAAWLLRLVFLLRFMPSRRRAARVLGLTVRRTKPPAPAPVDAAVRFPRPRQPAALESLGG
ncbi:NAD(P)/FAD-dependent oxidoreductase [Thalassiella azotivora]